MKPEPVAGSVRMVFDPISVGAMVGLVVLFAAMGYSSLRFLRKQPDFEHRREMLWGAKWFWVLVAGLIAFGHLVLYLGVTLTAYPLSFLTGASSVFYIGFVLLLCLLPWQAEGLFAWSVGFRAWMKRKPLDWLSALTKMERQHRRWWWRGGLIIGVALMAGLNAYMICRYTYPLERDLVEICQYDEIAAAIQRQLDSDMVLEVLAGPLPNRYERSLFILVPTATTGQHSTSLIDQTRQVMTAQHISEAWAITVYESQRTLAKAEYRPMGGASPGAGPVYQGERSPAQRREERELAAAVKEQLDSGAVLAVWAVPTPVRYELTVAVKVSEQTSAQEAVQMEKRIKYALAALGRSEKWLIRIYARHRGRLATGQYLPEEPANDTRSR